MLGYFSHFTHFVLGNDHSNVDEFNHVLNNWDENVAQNGKSVQKQRVKKTTPFKLYYLGQWKLEEKKLSTRTGNFLTGDWLIPDVGTSGTIQKKRNKRILECKF